MKRLLYPLLGASLITIVPFLLTFEKGQDIVRGLFGFGYFAILLIFVALKAVTFNSSAKEILKYVALGLLVTLLVSLAFVDLLNLLHEKNFELGIYALVPFFTSLFALVMVSKISGFGVRGISFILFVSLMTHLAFKNFYPSQPLLQMPLVEYLARSIPKENSPVLPEEFKAKYNVTDSVTISKNFIDFSKTNVLVLVESFGIPLSEELFEKQLQIFKDLKCSVGVHARMYSRTRTAEREDWIYQVTKDSLRNKDTLFLPKVFDSLGVKTIFLSGGDSSEHWRFRYIHNVGFKEVYFKESFGNLKEVSDSLIAFKIDSLLQDSLQKFISWTTRDTQFPMQVSSVEELEKLYFEKLNQTLKRVALIAKRFPDVRFIVQGDHEPILSPLEFQKRFYKRFVPYLILN